MIQLTLVALSTVIWSSVSTSAQTAGQPYSPEKLVIDFGFDYFGPVPSTATPLSESPSTRLVNRMKEFWSVPPDLESQKAHMVATMTVDTTGAVSNISIVQPSPIAAFNAAAINALAHLTPTPLILGDSPSEPMQVLVTFFYNEASRPGPIPRPLNWPPPGAFRLGDGVTAPQVVHRGKPFYTRLALQAKIEGTVHTEAVVRKDGTVGDAIIVRSLDQTFGLDRQALDSVKEWTFVPSTRNGEPVDVVVSIEVAFTRK